ncbi:GNAT family N-acetyltransferase [Streptomyces sp. NPDC018000]|uniref:GNAT family N-acetyltransferase n=1 Tax=Streptomyces sp. NPDC018000 TaxID=3365028 RepID=UPI0037A33086
MHDDSASSFTVRSAQESDISRLAEFEVEIAKISFAEDAITAVAVHEKRLSKAMARSRDGMFVACRGDRPTDGWVWITVNTNPMSGQRYANFRSLAVADVPERTLIGELLLHRGLEYVRSQGVEEVVGKVYVQNVRMRMLYRKFGFEATHLTMRLRGVGSRS